MKKFITFALVAVLLCAALCTSAFAAEEKPFFVTHFNDPYPEGAGVVFTDPYEHAGWWLHVVFEPVNGVENTYKITNIVSGLSDGTATPQEIPEGGFVWAANYGNDYPALNLGDIDYTNPNCNAAITDALTWSVGQMFTISGLDLEALTVPTSTPDVAWYEDSYVCTATYTLYEGDVPATSDGEPTDDSEDDTSAPADTESKTESKDDESKAPATSSADSSDAPADDAGMPIWVIALIVVAAVAVVAVIVIVIIKKK